MLAQKTGVSLAGVGTVKQVLTRVLDLKLRALPAKAERKPGCSCFLGKKAPVSAEFCKKTPVSTGVFNELPGKFARLGHKTSKAGVGPPKTGVHSELG